MTQARKLSPFSANLPVRPSRSAEEDICARTADNRPLVECARQVIRARNKTAELVPPGLIKDWAWDMLLELFVNNEEGALVYVKQLVLASGVSPPAAMRLIDRLEDENLIRRLGDPLDSRRVIVTLSERGRDAMVTLLRNLFDTQGSAGDRRVSGGPRGD